MPSPPKPWEVNNTAAASTPVVSQQNSMTELAAPTVPTRPSTMSGMSSGYGGLGNSYGAGGYGASGYGTGSYGAGGYGTGSYGTGYGTGAYGSSYSRYGGMGSYGGYVGYGGYGGYGSMGGYGAMGMNRGMYGPEDDSSLTQRMEAGTRATFDVIQSIVGAFGGFAQMLDSTYMATHSSFMAMVGVAEQFGNLKHYLGGIFSIFALIRWMKRILFRITGRAIPPELLPSTEEVSEQETLQITAEEITHETETVTEDHVSRKRPILLFLALVTGLPYLMYKLIQRSSQLRQQRMMIPQYGPPPQTARVLYDFVAENAIELNLRQGDTVQVLSTVDPATGAPCDWWQGRSAQGVIGIFPANYVHII